MKNYYTILDVSDDAQRIGFARTKYTINATGLPVGAIVLIVICCVILVGGIIAAIFTYRRNKFE